MSFEDKRYIDMEQTYGRCCDDDAELMARIRRGDSPSFEELYDKYRLPATAYAAALAGCDVSVADVVQEAFARLWNRRGEYRGEAAVRTYIFAYVRKVCLEERRFQKRRQILSKRLASGASPCDTASSVPEVAACLNEMSNLLEQTLARLSDVQEEALRLYYVEGMSLREAATFVGCTQKCLESRLYRGLAKLRRLLPHHDTYSKDRTFRCQKYRVSEEEKCRIF